MTSITLSAPVYKKGTASMTAGSTLGSAPMGLGGTPSSVSSARVDGSFDSKEQLDNTFAKIRALPEEHAQKAAVKYLKELRQIDHQKYEKLLMQFKAVSSSDDPLVMIRFIQQEVIKEYVTGLLSQHPIGLLQCSLYAFREIYDQMTPKDVFSLPQTMQVKIQQITNKHFIETPSTSQPTDVQQRASKLLTEALIKKNQGDLPIELQTGYKITVNNKGCILVHRFAARESGLLHTFSEKPVHFSPNKADMQKLLRHLNDGHLISAEATAEKLVDHLIDTYRHTKQSISLKEFFIPANSTDEDAEIFRACPGIIANLDYKKALENYKYKVDVAPVVQVSRQFVFSTICAEKYIDKEVEKDLFAIFNPATVRKIIAAAKNNLSRMDDSEFRNKILQELGIVASEQPICHAFALNVLEECYNKFFQPTPSIFGMVSNSGPCVIQ